MYRRVIWKHILNVYPEGMSGKERMDYTKRKSVEYYKLRDTWREMLKNGQVRSFPTLSKFINFVNNISMP